MRKTTRRSVKKGPAKVEPSLGNVFSDLGLSDPEERLAKARLAHRIASLIDAEDLTQAKAATRLGIDQPKVSMLVRGRLKDFSVERLMKFLVLLRKDVVISIEEPQDRLHPSLRVSVSA